MDRRNGQDQICCDQTSPFFVECRYKYRLDMRSETLYSNGIFLYFMQKYKYRLNILPERIIIRTVRIFWKRKRGL